MRIQYSEYFIKLFWLIANLRDWKLSRKHFLSNMSENINPNNKYFNKRRKLATLSLILSSFVCFLAIFILRPYASNPEIAKYIALISAVEAIKDGVLVSLYLVIATIHDISFEKIAQFAKDINEARK